MDGRGGKMTKCVSAISLFCGALALSFGSCQQHYAPKPKGYHRIELPEKAYETFNEDGAAGCPFQFVYPQYASIEKDTTPCWMDVVFPEFNARLHLTYVAMDEKSTLYQLTEDAREFAFKHTVKATGIDQERIKGSDADVHGLLYEINGNTASNIQFFLTDSAGHYLRGALYFGEKPRFDSIQPVLQFLRQDIERFVKDFHWTD